MKRYGISSSFLLYKSEMPFLSLFSKGEKQSMRILHGRIIAFILVLAVVFSATACAKKPAIGDIVFEAPITALLFEAGEDAGDTGYGVVYRKVNDINLLLAQEQVPVLLVFMDGRALSNSAIAFTEELCDKFADTARIVRVNVELSGNTQEISSLISLFDVSDYPWFAVAYKGQKKTAISGYSTDLESKITQMLQQAAK